MNTVAKPTAGPIGTTAKPVAELTETTKPTPPADMPTPRAVGDGGLDPDGLRTSLQGRWQTAAVGEEITGQLFLPAASKIGLADRVASPLFPPRLCSLLRDALSSLVHRGWMKASTTASTTVSMTADFEKSPDEALKESAFATVDHKEVGVQVAQLAQLAQQAQQAQQDATVRYHLDEVVHGQYDGKPACLLVIHFSFNCTKDHPLTTANITVTFGGKQQTDDGQPIVPFATSLWWPHEASGTSAVDGQPAAAMNLFLEASGGGGGGISVKTPEFGCTVAGKAADGGWRVASQPYLVERPFPWQRRYRWVTGNRFNAFPVPAEFSLGMVVQHSCVDFWTAVQVEGTLRGRLANHRSAWKPIPRGIWRVEPHNDKVVIDKALLETKMRRRHEELCCQKRSGEQPATQK